MSKEPEKKNAYLASKSKDNDANTPHHEADTISWNKSGAFDPAKNIIKEQHRQLN